MFLLDQWIFCHAPFSPWSLLLCKIQAFTTLATNCIEALGLNLAEKLSECRSRATTLEEEIVRLASLINQLPKDIKVLHTQKTST